jgi:ribosomal protein S3
LRSNIEYGFAEAATTAGLIGIKVWVCKAPEKAGAAETEKKSNAAYA